MTILAQGEFVELGVVAALILLGLIVGGLNERLHFKSLARRERDFADIVITDTGAFLGEVDAARRASLVMAEAVIANDYLKSFLAALRKLLGGEMKSYRSLMTRARREAIMRLARQTRDLGHNAMCNLRFEFSDIGGMASKGAVMVVVVASATAYTTQTGGAP